MLKFRQIKLPVKKILIQILDKLDLLKRKYLRANHSKFVTKEPSKAIMLRTKLRNQFFKSYNPYQE